MQSNKQKQANRVVAHVEIKTNIEEIKFQA